MTYLEELTNKVQRKPEGMAAGISSMVLQIRKERIKQSLFDMDTVGHRQEHVATIDGVMYYDDSRAESVNATWFTMENLVSPVVWIVGGDNQGNFSELKTIARNNVRALICIGPDSKKLVHTFRDTVTDIYQAENIEEATKMASLVAMTNDVVLFSPACPSDNKNESFETRGNRFINAVRQLENEHHQ